MKKIHALVVLFVLYAYSFNAQCTVKPVPFYDGFQSITASGQWPACWLGVSKGTLFTFIGPNGPFGGCNATGDSFFHSPQFILQTGVTYSASMLFSQSVEGNVFSKVALHLMKTTTLNLGEVASGTSFSTLDTIVGGTFSVANTGTYHIGVEMKKASGPAQISVLGFFDDLRIDCANNMIVNWPIAICEGEGVEIYASGATSYTFQNSNGTWNEIPHIDYPLADETYTVSGKIYGTCIESKIVNVLVDPCLGIEEHKLQVSLYPNPFTNQITIKTENNNGLISIFNLVGEMVYSTQITSHSTEINLNELPTGVYILHFVNGNNQQIIKLIRE